jgi:hypothetical protein
LEGLEEQGLLSHGVVLQENRSVLFDPECDQGDVLNNAKKINHGRIKVNVNVVATIRWMGGFGTPCVKVLEEQVNVDLRMLDPVLTPLSEKSLVLETHPSAYCE